MTTPKERLFTRFRDEAAGPPNGTEVALRCTDHGRFLMWVSPPAPAVRVACPPECDAGCAACRTVGPLLVGPGTSGRSWRCGCGRVWSPT